MSLMLPPRIILEVSCVPTAGGHWFACSPALPGISAGGAGGRRRARTGALAEGIAGEPVRALVTVEPEDEVSRERVCEVAAR